MPTFHQQIFSLNTMTMNCSYYKRRLMHHMTISVIRKLMSVKSKVKMTSSFMAPTLATTLHYPNSWHNTTVKNRSPEALDFIQVTRPKLTLPCRHQDYILNMDQTPVPFSYDPKSTLELVGRRTVHVRKSTNDTKRATVALCVTASGKALTPMIVFKGKPKGRM